MQESNTADTKANSLTDHQQQIVSQALNRIASPHVRHIGATRFQSLDMALLPYELVNSPAFVALVGQAVRLFDKQAADDSNPILNRSDGLDALVIQRGLKELIQKHKKIGQHEAQEITNTTMAIIRNTALPEKAVNLSHAA